MSKVVIITGGAGGIGKGFMKGFMGTGYFSSHSFSGPTYDATRPGFSAQPSSIFRPQREK